MVDLKPQVYTGSSGGRLDSGDQPVENRVSRGDDTEAQLEFIAVAPSLPLAMP